MVDGGYGTDAWSWALTAVHGAGWQAPVLSFIDENCIVFDDADENQVCEPPQTPLWCALSCCALSLPPPPTCDSYPTKDESQGPGARFSAALTGGALAAITLGAALAVHSACVRVRAPLPNVATINLIPPEIAPQECLPARGKLSRTSPPSPPELDGSA